jgi:MFS superfamily sulfate permease-like transporter
MTSYYNSYYRDDPPVFRNRERFPEGKAVKHVLIYRQDAPLFYANADSFQETILRLSDTEKVVVVHGGAMPLVDSTGAVTLVRIKRRLLERGKAMILCEFNGPVRDALYNAHVAKGGPKCVEDERKDDGGDAPAPMFVSLTDAIVRAKELAAAMETTSPREVTVGLDSSALRTSARLSEDGAMTAVSADDL